MSFLHLPTVSPWARCAGSAFRLTRIVFLPLWQTVTFLPPYWYWCAETELDAKPAPLNAQKHERMTAAAVTSRAARRAGRE